ncbi:MAG: flavoprotein [Planctomycetota bacterium]
MKAARAITLGVTGSIAAYKAPDIVSQLVKAGVDVHPVLTKAGARFVTALSLSIMAGRPAVTDLFDEKDFPGHIDLAAQTDLLLIAPATANIIGKIAAGIADDALSTVALAARGKTVIAPAMNPVMYKYPAVARNVKTLEGWGMRFIPPEKGRLACGEWGEGKLAAVETIVTVVLEELARVRKK